MWMTGIFKEKLPLESLQAAWFSNIHGNVSGWQCAQKKYSFIGATKYQLERSPEFSVCPLHHRVFQLCSLISLSDFQSGVYVRRLLQLEHNEVGCYPHTKWSGRSFILIKSVPMKLSIRWITSLAYSIAVSNCIATFQYFFLHALSLNPRLSTFEQSC